MMNIENYHFMGMHLFWWVIWIITILWIVILTYNIIRQKVNRETPLDILKKRFAQGKINNEEYQEKKKIIEL